MLHVDAVNAESLHFENRTDGIEAHFHIDKSGQCEQYRSTEFEADAQYHGNSFALNGKLVGFVSIETQGFGEGKWNRKQRKAIKRLLEWLSETHDFPLRKCPGPFEAGVGYHTMWGAPGEWTPVAKSCPGPDRIKQFNDWLVPWMNTKLVTRYRVIKPNGKADDDLRKLRGAMKRAKKLLSDAKEGDVVKIKKVKERVKR